MKRMILLGVGIVGVLLIILMVTCPDQDDYYDWLADEFNIACVVTDVEIVCKENDQIIEWNSRHIRRAGMYLQVEDHYSASNREYKIKAIGIFNHFINYSSIIIYD